jgi:hypothetical protein
MSEARSFRDLDAWQVAMVTVEPTYTLTSLFPDTERFGLVSQMRVLQYQCLPVSP